MFVNSHLHIPRGLTDPQEQSPSVIDNMRSVNVFVFKFETTFNLSCLTRDDENALETREIVQLGDKSFAKSFISVAEMIEMIEL